MGTSLRIKDRKRTARADAGARAMKAWSARVVGLTWMEAAETAGFSDGPHACRAVKNFFGQLPDIDREDQRDLWRERLEHLWRQAVVDTQEQKPGAVRSAVSIAQRASALDGLDKPTRVELYDPTAEELERLVDELVAAHDAQLPVEGDIFQLEESDREVRKEP